MGFWQRVGQRLGIRSAYSRPVDPSRALTALPLSWIPTSLRLSEDESTSVSAVWACIQVISNAIASSPWLVYEVEGRRRTYKPDDPLAFVLNQRSNDEMTAIALREALLYGAFATGNGYAEIVRDNAGRVTGLIPLDSRNVIPTRKPDTNKLVYVYYDPMGGTAEIPAAAMFHLRGPVSIGGLLGDSIVARASRAIALSAAVERFGVNYLANGAVPSIVLKYPGKVSDKDFDRLKAQWEERYSGPKKSGRPLILEGGMDTKDVSADPQKAMMIDTGQWSIEQVARFFNVPLVLLGVESAAQGYGVNLSTMMRAFRVGTLTPWQMRLEQEANAKLLSRKPYRETCIDTTWLHREDAKTQAEADKIRIESGVLTVNEVREEMGENTIGPEGDIRLVSAALTPLTTTLLDIQELAAKEPEPAQSPAAAAPETDTEDDPEDETEDAEEESPMLRQALRQMVLQNLERLDKRVAKRVDELRGKGAKPDDIAKRLSEDLEAFRSWMAKDCYPAIALIRETAKAQGRHLNGEADEALLAAVDAVAKGKPPAAEADRLISELLPEAQS